MLNSVKYDSTLISFSASWQVNSFFENLRNIYSMQLQFSFFHFLGYAVSVSKFSELFSYAAKAFLPGINSAQVFCGRVCMKKISERGKEERMAKAEGNEEEKRKREEEKEENEMETVKR